MITKINFDDRTIKSYAIRKFTPFECFRLMGVRDDVIKTMQSSNARAAEIVPEHKGKGKPEDMVISASQQYKMAGNSIVVDVLAAIYEQLWFPKATKAKGGQLSLFEEETLPDTPVEADSANKEKVFLTLFSGYDSQLMAADVLRQRHPDFKWTCAGWSDIDKYACMMHNLVFPQFADKALGDVTKIDWHKVKSTLAGGANCRYAHLQQPLPRYFTMWQADGVEGRIRHSFCPIVERGGRNRGVAPQVSVAGECGRIGEQEVHARLPAVA